MEMNEGSCRFGFWYINVYWSGHIIHRVRFSPHPCPGRAPLCFSRFIAGNVDSLAPFTSVASAGEGVYPRIYQAAMEIGYGTTATYGEIAKSAGTAPRVVGQAMARNPTPLVIPCHRVVGKHDIGGFTPSIEIKEALLSMEKKQAIKRRMMKEREAAGDA